MKRLILLLLLFASPAWALTEFREYGLTNAVTVTPSDTATFSPPLRRLMVLTGSTNQTVKVDMLETGTGITFTLSAPGVYILAISVKRVYSTGTTAPTIVGLW